MSILKILLLPTVSDKITGYVPHSVARVQHAYDSSCKTWELNAEVNRVSQCRVMWLKRLSWAGLAALLMMSGSLSGAQGDCETNRLGWSVFPVSSVCVCVFSARDDLGHHHLAVQFRGVKYGMGGLVVQERIKGQPLASARLVCERLSRWPCGCLNRQFQCRSSVVSKLEGCPRDNSVKNLHSTFETNMCAVSREHACELRISIRRKCEYSCEKT